MSNPEPGVGHNSEVEVSYDDLRELLDEVDSTGKAVSEASGKHRSKIKEIVEDQQWNKGAFGHIRSIEKMSETSRRDYLRTFKALFEVMCEAAWDDELKDMLEGAEGEED